MTYLGLVLSPRVTTVAFISIKPTNSQITRACSDCRDCGCAFVDAYSKRAVRIEGETFCKFFLVSRSVVRDVYLEKKNSQCEKIESFLDLFLIDYTCLL